MLATLLGTQVMLNIDEKSNGKYKKRGPSPSLWRQQGLGCSPSKSCEGAPARLPAASLLPLEEISGRLASQPLESRSLARSSGVAIWAVAAPCPLLA